jgi:hypothetical protein
LRARSSFSILDAIARTVEQVELDDALHCVADERWVKVLATGGAVPFVGRCESLARASTALGAAA